MRELTPPRVLIVEDNPNLTYLLEYYCRDLPIEPVFMDPGEPVIEALRAGRFALLILGWRHRTAAACEEIVAAVREEGLRVKVVLNCISDSMSEEVFDRLERSATEILHMPFSRQAFRLSLRRVLRGRLPETRKVVRDEPSDWRLDGPLVVTAKKAAEMDRPSEKFRAWVDKWQIGPGMNDNRAGTAHVETYSGYDGDVGDGWVPILDRLAEDLVAMGWDRDLHQVKEKFGELRFYVGDATEDMQHRINEARIESTKTCEWCGERGHARGGRWHRTLCDACHSQRRAGRP